MNKMGITNQLTERDADLLGLDENPIDERPCGTCDVRAGIRIDLCSVGICVREGYDTDVPIGRNY